MRFTHLNYTRILISLTLSASLLLAGCGSLPMPTAFATHAAPQIVIPTGTLRPTETTTPTEVSSVMQGTPVPMPPQPISAAGADKFKRLVSWGMGIPQAMTWSKDGSIVLVGTTSGLIFFDASSLTVKRFIESSIAVRSVAYSSGGPQLAVGFQDGSIEVWDANHTKLLAHLNKSSGQPVIALTFSLDGNDLGASLWNKSVAQLGISDIFGGTPRVANKNSIYGFSSPVTAMIYDSTNNYMYTFQSGAPINIFKTGKASKYKQLNVANDDSGKPPINAAFSHDQNWFAANFGSSIHIQRLSDGAVTNTLGPFADAMTAITFSGDSTMLAAASNSSINVWQTNGFTAVKNFAIPNTSQPVQFLAFSWDGKAVAAFSDTLRVWQLNADKPIEAKNSAFISGYRGAFNFTHDSAGVMVAQLDGSVRTYKMPDGAPQAGLKLPDLNSKGMALSPDGSMVAAISGNKAYVWKTSDGQQVAEMDGQRAMNGGLAFSPDGKYLAAPGLDKTIVVWRLSDQTILGTVPCPDIAWKVAFSPDGALLAAITNGVISIFQLSDGKMRYQVNGYSVTFSADGKTMAVSFGNADSARITLYNSADGKVKNDFAADGGSLALSPDGKLLAVGGASLVVLQTSDGKVVKSLENPAPFGPLLFSPDGKWLGTAGWDGRVFLWGEE